MMLSVNNLSIGYGKRELLSGIDFTLEAGEICVLIGPNGAGKSTLLKTIAGVIPAISGEVELEGAGKLVAADKRMQKVSEIERARLMATLFTTNLEPDYSTCFDVVAMGRFPYTGSFGLLSDEDREVVSGSLKMVGGEELSQLEFKRLSDGQKQRVLMARLFAQQPKLILLDEPTTFLDIRYKLEIMQSLKAYVEATGATVLMSLHELDLAKDVADSVLAVDGGDGDESPAKAYAKMQPEEAFRDEFIKRLFHISGN